MGEKETEFSMPWQDQRPLIIFTGDSEIELGDWYNLFSGEWAIRNCGLSRAKIADVAKLTLAMSDLQPKLVVLMCGVNSLRAQENPESCLSDYESLLTNLKSHLHPESVLVLSVMPVRESAVDQAAHQFNATVTRFNAKLAAYCQQQQIKFLDVSPAVTDTNGGFASDLTLDGLHPNTEGYRRLAEIISPQLDSMMRAP